ncbi:MAG: hypothetical protein SGPRY_003100 [Prymnesium sp.]
MLMSLVAMASFAALLGGHPSSPRAPQPRMAADSLRIFLQQRAGISARFVDRVLDICEQEMIDDVTQLRVAKDAGLLRQLFKPVVAIGIETALSSPPDVTEAASSLRGLLADDSPSVPDDSRVTPKINLEATPYFDNSKLPLNTYKAKNPLQGSIASVRRIVGAAAPGEVCHVKIDSGSTFKYWEGQSLGIVPPGINPKNGKPNSVRLYSIASTRYGDDLDGQSVSLCVRRAVYWDKELGREDPAKKGVCSNYLCDATPGTPVTLTGPTGKVMLMPETDPMADLIMVATGTGIAPYRGFLRRLFVENSPAGAAFKGLAWLFLGVSTSDSLLYDDDWQERLAEHAEEIFERLDKGAHMYFCGLKGMMPGILETLEAVAASKGISWTERLESLKAAGQWHVEVY